ncbi:MAG: tetratricopeptide repeat protein [Bacteroidales bacterium]|nr:tetratricopeptide repeat protein [Bacteroidales bacterium]
MMKKTYILLLLSLFCINVAANESDQLIEEVDSIAVPIMTESIETLSKNEADSAYIKGEYQKAIDIYEALLEEGVAAEVYYNLGNSYYKSDNIGKAILNYERALLLNPSNKDIQANLAIARSKTVDKVEPLPELFFISWTKSIMNQASADGWAKWALTFFLFFLICAFLYVFSRRILLKKISFGLGILFFLFMLASHSFARHQKKVLLNRDTAVVMTPSVTIKSTPSESGISLFILHEGRKVTIKDSVGEWKEIMIEDGKVGWINSNNIEII